jgi:hypothetical protein
MLTKETGFSSQTNQILKGLLDIRPNPVVIVDYQTKECLFNNKWSENIKKIKDLDKFTSLKFITIANQRFRINKEELNHGTKCLLIELIPYDESVDKLRSSTQKLVRMMQEVGG